MTINIKNNKKGFTLIETMVALFIFSVSIMTVMSVLSQGISSTNYAKNKIVAEYLSQEGIEYIRNIRDTYQLYSSDANTGWGLFVQKLQGHGCREKGCYFDNDENKLEQGEMPITGISFYSCGDKCPNFLYSPSTGKYNYYDGDTSVFSRKILVNQIDDDNLKITSEVTWKSGNQTGTISFSENLSNWIE
ncbi:MAG: prepilin-type N-terminal cleavage/methylation domain-containing protein [bacterium]